MTSRIGQYQLYQTLGKGNFSKVKYGVDVNDGTAWAVKIVDRKMIQKENLESQLRREIAIMKLLSHRHVVKLREVLQSPTNIYIILELVTGGELFDRIVKAKRFDEKTSRKYFHQLISGISYCHSQDVSHRDLKPENLLLDDKDVLKISDFGLSALCVGAGDTKKMLMTTCGTPNYVAPEVLLEKGYDGKKADIWSCGVILYVMLTGHFPFSADSIQELFKKIKNGEHNPFPPYVSSEAKDLIKKMLIVNPNYRISIEGVMKHSWFMEDGGSEYTKQNLESSISSREDKIIITQEEIDRSVTDCSETQVHSASQHVSALDSPSSNKKAPLNAFDLASIMMSGFVNPLVNHVPNASHKTVNIRRETRFIARGDKKTVLEEIRSVLSEKLQVKVSTTHLSDLESGKHSQQNASDQNLSDMKCFATVKQVGVTFSVKVDQTSVGFCLVEIRRGKGSIIDFNYLYRQILSLMGEVVISGGVQTSSSDRLSQ